MPGPDTLNLPDHSWRVTWYVGLYEKLLKPKSGRRIVWHREEVLNGKKWPIGLVEDDKGRMLILGNEAIQFSVPADIKDALEILGRIAPMARSKKDGEVCIAPANAIKQGQNPGRPCFVK
jgi:hypothetical protein